MQSIIANLKKRGFEAVYAKNREEAVEKALSFIEKGSSVSWGGSVSVEESGLIQRLKAGAYELIDRSKAKSGEEKTELMRKALLADTFLTSFNAVSRDGVLFNIDGNGNRVAAIAFGPKQVIALVGKNKIVDSESELENRALKIAAPKNAKRLSLSDEKDICAIFVKTRICRTKGRIKIILVDENLGY